jgi:hypothetical protein
LEKQAMLQVPFCAADAEVDEDGTIRFCVCGFFDDKARLKRNPPVNWQSSTNISKFGCIGRETDRYCIWNRSLELFYACPIKQSIIYKGNCLIIKNTKSTSISHCLHNN